MKTILRRTLLTWSLENALRFTCTSLGLTYGRQMVLVQHGPKAPHGNHHPWFR